MRGRYERKVFWCVSALFLVLCVWLGTRLEYKTEMTELPLSKEATGNPYLGAQRILQELGVKVTSQSGLFAEFFPDPGDTVMIPVSRAKVDPQTMNRLLDWVMQEEGHLVVVPILGDEEDDDGYVHLDDPFLEPLGFGASGFRTTFLDAMMLHMDVAEAEQVELVGWDVSTRDEYLRIGPDAGVDIWIWTDDPSTDLEWLFHWGNEQSLKGLSRELGSGILTVVSDSLFLNNRFVGHGDNAVLLSDIAGLKEDSRQVHFITRIDAPGLLSLIWGLAPQLILALAVSFLLWLWLRIKRFGPLEPQDVKERRRLMEHIEASGRFLWHGKQGKTLLAANRERINQVVARRTAYSLKPGTKPFYEWVHNRTGIEIINIQEALDDSSLEKSASDSIKFIETVRVLESIRKAL